MRRASGAKWNLKVRKRLDRDLGFLRGRQGYRPHDDDDDEEEDNEVEDNDKDDENDKDNNNDKGISVLGLDRDMGFS